VDEDDDGKKRSNNGEFRLRKPGTGSSGRASWGDVIVTSNSGFFGRDIKRRAALGPVGMGLVKTMAGDDDVVVVVVVLVIGGG
jgi:hypothetical protein